MEAFFIYLLKSAGLLTAFLIFYILLLKKDTTFITNRKFLLGGLLTSAILPAIYFTKTVIIKAQPSQFQLTEASFPVTEMAIQEPTITPLEIIAGIYLLGCAVMIIRLLLQLFSLSKVLLSGKFSREENANLIETKWHVAPFSFLNYIVYNPDLHSRTELEYILKHERAHVQQGHTLDVLLGNLNLIYQWFNPFAWLYLKSIQQNLEYIADSEAVKKASCKKEYQKALVKISVENYNLALTNNFYQSLIKKRIVMLNKSSSNKSTSWKTVLIFPALLAFIFLFNIKTVAQVVTEEQKEISKDIMSTDFEISFQIKNTSKEDQLESYIRVLKRYKVQLEFENVIRNDEGLITGITASFLDKNNNSSGSITRQNEDGIKDFVFYYSEKDGAGFRSATNDLGSGSVTMVSDLGEEPLIVIEKKQYSSVQLEGKAIKIIGNVTSMSSSTAVKTYGNVAKDGALIISKGQVIDDFDAEIKEIDQQDQNAVRDYILFEKGKKPMFINLNKSFSANSMNIVKGQEGTITAVSSGKNIGEAVIVSGSNSAVSLGNLRIPGKKPIYIINGQVFGSNATIDTIDPASIKGVNILKGYSATAVYGKDAKDGAIIISTRKAGDTTGFNFHTGNLILRDSANPKNVIYTSSKVKFVDLDSLSPSRRTFVLTNTNGQYYDLPLYIVDGEEMDSNFNVNSLNNSTINSMVVIKGAEAVAKYGEEAKGGAVEISTKSSSVNGTPRAFVATIKASTTDEGLKITKEQIFKQAGIEVNFKNVKRNKEGLITSILVSAKHEKEVVTLTASETGAISDIYISKVNNKIKVTTNP